MQRCNEVNTCYQDRQSSCADQIHLSLMADKSQQALAVSIPPPLLFNLTSEIASQILNWHFAFPKVLDDFYRLEDMTLK